MNDITSIDDKFKQEAARILFEEAHILLATGHDLEKFMEEKLGEVSARLLRNLRAQGFCVVRSKNDTGLNEEQIQNDALEIASELSMQELLKIESYEDSLAVTSIIEKGVTEAVKNAYNQDISPISDLKEKLSHALERVEELETPDLFSVDPEEYANYRGAESYSSLEQLLIGLKLDAAVIHTVKRRRTLPPLFVVIDYDESKDQSQARSFLSVEDAEFALKGLGE